MLNNELANISNKELGFKHIKIVDMEKFGDYLFFRLDNGQKVLTNGAEIYDVSDYYHLSNIFHMEDKFCAVMTKNFSTCVVDLNTMEVLFEDENAWHISKQDDRTLHVIMKIGGGNNTIYDIETKQYLPAPDDYEFENSLGNNLYVFRERHNSHTSFFDYKRCVINADGKILLKDIDGWIEISNNYLIIEKEKDLCIVKVNEDFTLDMKTIEQNDEIIAKPTYHNGHFIIMEAGVIKMFTPDLELAREIAVDELQEVIDYEIVSNTLKLCLPYTIDGKQVNKHLFVNLSTGKAISHLRIEGYPYWTPLTYIGQDSLDSEITDYHFYNNNFEPVITIAANSYESVDSNKERMFVIRTFDGENEHRQLLNAENGSIRDVDYDYIHFHLSLPYGYGVNLSTQKMDFFDENLNVIIPDFDYNKFNFSIYHEGFSYFIVNNYLCIYKHFVDGYGESKWRTILQKADGEVILDSIQHKCYAMGNFIQIVHNEDSEFLNTITGEIGSLGITALVDDTGKIDFERVNSINNILSIESNTLLGLPSSEEKQPAKIKKLRCDKKIDD